MKSMESSDDDDEEALPSSDLPSHSEIIQSFDADGNFLTEKKSLLYKFYSPKNQKQIKNMIKSN